MIWLIELCNPLVGVGTETPSPSVSSSASASSTSLAPPVALGRASRDASDTVLPGFQEMNYVSRFPK